MHTLLDIASPLTFLTLSAVFVAGCTFGMLIASLLHIAKRNDAFLDTAAMSAGLSELRRIEPVVDIPPRPISEFDGPGQHAGGPLFSERPRV